MHVKHHMFGEDTDAPEIDGKAASASIALYLYKAGKYEQWCFDWKKDPNQYWLQMYGEEYADMKSRNPVRQQFKNPQAARAAAGAERAKKQKNSLFGIFKG